MSSFHKNLKTCFFDKLAFLIPTLTRKCFLTTIYDSGLVAFELGPGDLSDNEVFAKLLLLFVIVHLQW